LNGGDLSPKYFSTQGAFNGSGIALASQSFQGDEQGTMVLYYQHYAGTIRFKQLRDGKWVGGTQSEIVAYDAKNGTPISAVAYALHNTSTVSGGDRVPISGSNEYLVAHLLRRYREPHTPEDEQ
jgi:hypothetical protein